MNKVILIGNVGAEPEVRYYEQDQCIAQLRLATTERGYTLQNGTQVPDRTDWHPIRFYRKLAKVVDQYVHKGDKLYVEGRLRRREWDDKKGVHHYGYEIDAENMEMLTPKRQDAATTPQSQTVAQQTAQQPSPTNNEQEVLPF